MASRNQRLTSIYTRSQQTSPVKGYTVNLLDLERHLDSLNYSTLPKQSQSIMHEFGSIPVTLSL